ncbi:MAG: septal ring lytic transglycosylase RlpA family protein [Alphaproteobacteria bacterium]
MRQLAATALTALVLTACASREEPQTQLPPSPYPPGSDMAVLPDGRGGTYKVGTPYYINGVRYVPKVDKRHDERGIASWYGPNFHGKPTANGETFDMYKISAAHRTLPMPSMVRVTNLENGKSLIVRMNDRGPFARGRVIDMSYRAAQLLDFEHQGTAKVRVQYVGPAEIPPPAVPKPPVQEVRLEPLEPLPPARPAPLPSPVVDTYEPEPLPPPSSPLYVETQDLPPITSQIYVQAGAFSDPVNASRLRDDLQRIGPAQVSSTVVNGREFHRVRIGPIGTVEQADEILARVVASGQTNARILVDEWQN